jgi:hypothetical protein
MKNLSLSLEKMVLSREQMRFISGGNELSDGIDNGKCNKKKCSSNADCGNGKGICATYSGHPCSGHGPCGCGQYCL